MSFLGPLCASLYLLIEWPHNSPWPSPCLPPPRCLVKSLPSVLMCYYSIHHQCIIFEPLLWRTFIIIINIFIINQSINQINIVRHHSVPGTFLSVLPPQWLLMQTLLPLPLYNEHTERLNHLCGSHSWGAIESGPESRQLGPRAQVHNHYLIHVSSTHLQEPTMCQALSEVLQR